MYFTVVLEKSQPVCVLPTVETRSLRALSWHVHTQGPRGPSRAHTPAASDTCIRPKACVPLVVSLRIPEGLSPCSTLSIDWRACAQAALPDPAGAASARASGQGPFPVSPRAGMTVAMQMLLPGRRDLVLFLPASPGPTPEAGL